MTNKTIEQKLVIREPGLQGPREGYTRVVMREAGLTREFFKLLDGSEQIKLPLLGSKADLVTYYVDRYPHLRFEVGPVSCLHVSRLDGRDFTLTFSLKYAIDDPRSLVVYLDRDPLARIEAELARVLSDPIERLPWEEILDDETDFATRALGAKTGTLDDVGRESTCVDHLNKFADQLGIRMEISVARALGEAVVSARNRIEGDERAIERRSREEKRKAEEHKFEITEQDREMERRMRKTRGEAGIKFLETLRQSVEGALERNLEQARSIPEVARFTLELHNLMGRQGVFPPFEPFGADNLTAVTDQSCDDDPARLLASGKIGDLISRLEADVASLHDARAEQDLLASALHVIAEAQHDPDKRRDMARFLENLEAAVRERAQALADANAFALLDNLVTYYQAGSEHE